MKRLLILGNGYHIGNKYKTSYKNFKYFLCNSEKYLKTIESSGHVRDESREYWHPATVDMINVNNIDEYFSETARIAEVNYFDLNYINQFKQTKLYKILEVEDKNYDLWSDVEEGIRIILDKIYKYYNYGLIENNKIVEYCKEIREEELVIEIFKNVLLFEKSFASYLLMFNEPFDCGTYNMIGNKYEKDNVNMNLGRYFNEKLDVISFNFFKCSGDIDMLINIKDGDAERYINIHNTVECNRNFDKQILIGIQDGYFDKDLYIRFEKIQRLHSLGVDIKSKVLERLELYDEYIVYGHSIGLSDYYFFSKIIDCVIKGNKKLIVYWHSNEGRKKIIKNIEYYVKDNLNYERVKNIPLNIEFVKILIPKQ